MEGEDTYSPAEASRVLGLSISARRIRHMIQAREPEGEGDKGGRWRIPRCGELRFGVMLFGDRLQLAIVFADAPCERADRLEEEPEGRQERLGMCSGALLWKLAAGHLGSLAPKDLTAPRT